MRNTTLMFVLAVMALSATAAARRAEAGPPIEKVTRLCDAQRLSIGCGYVGFAGWGGSYWNYGCVTCSWWWNPSDVVYWWYYPHVGAMYYSPWYPMYWPTVFAPTQTPNTGVANYGYQPPPPRVTYATIDVHLPADAELWIDGKKMTETGVRRSFNTAALAEGQTLSVEVRASWTANKKEVSQAQTVRVQAGNQRVMNFMASGSEAKK